MAERTPHTVTFRRAPNMDREMVTKCSVNEAHAFCDNQARMNILHHTISIADADGKVVYRGPAPEAA